MPSLTVSKTFLGSAVADSLPGGTVGYDAGFSETGGVPVNNSLFVRHDFLSKVMNLSYHFGPYSGTYGGDFSISADYAKLVTHGDAGGGCQIEENAFAGTPFATLFQLATGAGVSFATRRNVQTSSMVRNNAGAPATPSAPVIGEVGPTGNTILGEGIRLLQRYIVPSSETQGGRRQTDLNLSYAYTT
jgi:hypothetical protein